MKQRILFLLHILWQFSWGLIQSLIGLIGFLFLIRKRHVIYKGSVVTEVPGYWGGVTLGMFIFVDYLPNNKECIQKNNTVKHEYGHVLQSLILGPIWFLIIGLPSLIWAGCFDSYRAKHNISYYDFYTEKWANRLGKAYLD